MRPGLDAQTVLLTNKECHWGEKEIQRDSGRRAGSWCRTGEIWENRARGNKQRRRDQGH